MSGLEMEGRSRLLLQRAFEPMDAPLPLCTHFTETQTRDRCETVFSATLQSRDGARRDLKERENVEFVGDVLSHLVETDTHEADVGTTQLVCRLLQYTTH